MNPALPTHRYVLRETAASGGINTALSMGFFLAVFGLDPVVRVWGMGNYAFDFVPQSFAVAFFGALVPSLLARKATLAGKLPSLVHANPAVGKIVLRALAIGIAAMALGSGAWALALMVAGIDTLAFGPAFTIKLLHGAALGGIATHVSLKWTLE